MHLAASRDGVGRRLCGIVLMMLVAPISALAQERIVGLVEIPQLHSGVNEGDDDQALGPVSLYSEPLLNASVAFVAEDRRQLESREHGYEQVSAVVFQVSQSNNGTAWYRLKFTKEGESGYGWLRSRDAGQFRSLLTLLSSRGLTYLTESWDGRLHESPRLDSPATTFPDREEYQETRIVDSYNRPGGPEGDRWYLVVLVRGSCSGEPLEVIDFGWVPTYAESGESNLWYYARGC